MYYIINTGPGDNLEVEELKKIASEKAVDHIKDGMIVGLGTGSTVEYALHKIGSLVKDGLEIYGIPTSLHTRRVAKEQNIPKNWELLIKKNQWIKFLSKAAIK